jgi:peroxiredoxin
MLALGTKAPHFELPDTVSGKVLSLADIKSDVATVVMFICNHCPYVIHVNDEIVRTANDYLPKGVQFIAISSNDVENYPVDSPENMTAFAEDARYAFPYLYDESQSVAKAYEAACTPDFYVFDGDLALVYRGRMDASSPGNGVENNGADLRAAIQATIDGKAIAVEQVPSMGCNIKWKQ